MPADIGPRGRGWISDRQKRHVEFFDAVPTHNLVYECDDGDEVLVELTLAAERTHFAAKAVGNRDIDDDPLAAPDDAWRPLRAAVRARVDELVAQACADTLKHSDEWFDHYDDEAIRASQEEARRWLQQHPEVAKRAGVWEEVTAGA